MKANRVISFLLVTVLLALGLASCGGGGNPSSAKKAPLDATGFYNFKADDGNIYVLSDGNVAMINIERGTLDFLEVTAPLDKFMDVENKNWSIIDNFPSTINELSISVDDGDNLLLTYTAHVKNGKGASYPRIHLIRLFTSKRNDFMIFSERGNPDASSKFVFITKKIADNYIKAKVDYDTYTSKVTDIDTFAKFIESFR